MEVLGFGVIINGIDLPFQIYPAASHEAVGFVKRDPHSIDALAAAYKIDLH
jgi:hypothetical protein